MEACLCGALSPVRCVPFDAWCDTIPTRGNVRLEVNGDAEARFSIDESRQVHLTRNDVEARESGFGPDRRLSDRPKTTPCTDLHKSVIAPC